ncbi:class V chitinase Chi100 [Fusarium denticulatum]|uniref:Class V chitinase Chi100 n=1 Tax=Fusarium denticulatum TaxID=48507 RepID=A0A8H5SY60_9HYPO|nr:class V chitinase Chi100 [Fusarium denticulatum]
MWLSNKSLWTSVLLGTGIVQSAIKTDGSKPVDPVNEDDPSPISDINTCTYGPNSTNFMAASQSSVDNPKKSSKLYQGGSLRTAAACAIDGEPSDVQLLLDESGDKTDGSRVLKLLEGLRKFFELQDNCDENFLFSYYQQTIAGIFVGNGLGKLTVNSLSELTTIELCGVNRKREQVFGISINAHGNLAEIQKQLMNWSEGKCALKPVSLSTKRISGVKMFDIIGMKGFENTEDSPSTPTPEPTSRPQNVSPRFLGSLFSKRATCKHIQVVSGDSCAALAARCNIRGNDFLKYNPQKNLCSTLKENDYVCCSSGEPFKPEPPKPSTDGTCATHLIKDGDTCDSLAREAGVTIQDLEKFNKGRTWAWTDCKDLLLGYNMCLGPGNPPMPPPQEGAECGPLVPGTKGPTNKSVSIADLNPCPLKACCSNWGFCSVFPAHCTDNSPEGGGPGSKKKSFQTSCVSNCGNKIKQNSGPPSAFQRIGCYEAYGMNRDCLWLNAKDANTDGSSAINNNPSWSTTTCPQEAATTTHREDAKATAVWKNEHHSSWLKQKDRKHKAQCDMDEYPPAYLLTKADPAWQFAGKDKRGQRLRYLPYDENAGAALMWRSICLKTPLDRLSDSELWNRIKRGTNKQATHPTNQKEVMMMEIVIGERPEFTISYDHERNPKPDAALADNPCLPDKLAVNDPGFALLKLDEWDPHFVSVMCPVSTKQYGFPQNLFFWSYATHDAEAASSGVGALLTPSDLA